MGRGRLRTDDSKTHTHTHTCGFVLLEDSPFRLASEGKARHLWESRPLRRHTHAVCVSLGADSMGMAPSSLALEVLRVW